MYGLYRAFNRPGMSLILTVLSLGTRVCLAYVLSSVPFIGVNGIWWSVPAGWLLADFIGVFYYKKIEKRKSFYNYAFVTERFFDKQESFFITATYCVEMDPICKRTYRSRIFITAYF